MSCVHEFLYMSFCISLGAEKGVMFFYNDNMLVLSYFAEN